MTFCAVLLPISGTKCLLLVEHTLDSLQRQHGVCVSQYSGNTGSGFL